MESKKNSYSRQELRCVFVDFKKLPRSVVVEAADCVANIFATIDLCLVLTLPRLNINNRNSSVESSEIL